MGTLLCVQGVIRLNVDETTLLNSFQRLFEAPLQLPFEAHGKDLLQLIRNGDL